MNVTVARALQSESPFALECSVSRDLMGVAEVARLLARTLASSGYGANHHGRSPTEPVTTRSSADSQVCGKDFGSGVFPLEAFNGIPRTCSCSSPEGTTLSQPRVKRRERSERRATLGCENHSPRNPKGVALTKKRHHIPIIYLCRAAPSGLWVCVGRLPRVAQTLAELAFAPRWANIGLCLRHERGRNKTGAAPDQLLYPKVNTPLRESSRL